MSLRHRLARTALMGGAVAMALAATTPADVATGPLTDVLVRPATSLDAVRADVERLGGQVTASWETVGLLSASVPANLLDELAADTDVEGWAPSADIDFAQADDTPDDTAESADDRDLADGDLRIVARTTGASTFHQKGVRGAGIDVAVIDTGIAAVAGVTPNITGRVDLSFDAGNPERANTDGYGHGTHLAGIISTLAPGAGLVDVRVGDTIGAADVSQVIAGIDWAIRNRATDGRNIRVINLSFGTPATQDWRIDPLAYAVEAAWRNGIVVVVAAGNGGAGASSLVNPATNPLAIAVGASTTGSTARRGDDAMADFSQAGSSTRPPDLVAPGRSVPSSMPTDATVARQNPSAWQGDRFVGSGTSQAAAVVSAGAALLLEAHAGMTPDEVKYAMGRSATDLEPGRSRDGRGLLDLVGAYRVGRTGFVQKVASSNGSGSLEASRGGRHVELVMDDGSTVVLEGEVDFTGANWTGKAWAGANWSGSNWNGSNWNGSNWNGSNWNGSNWNGSNWNGANWSGANWSGANWSGANWSAAVWGD